MRCEDVMHRPVECVRESESVQAAARKMRDANVGFIPICGGDGRVLGTLTDRDIAIRLTAEDRSAATTTIAEVMTREVIACSPHDELSRAAELMRTHHKSRVLVIDERHALVGVISLSDLAQYEVAGAAETLRDVAQREVLDTHGTRAPAEPRA